MKKIFALLLALCLTLSAPLALAADNPFLPGIDYTEHWDDHGARPSMLNFGYCDLAPGQSFFDAKTTTVTKSSAKNLEKSLDKLDYYIYAKWQHAYAFDYYYIDAMLVMTDPTGNHYAKYMNTELIDASKRIIYRWFWPVNSLLERCLEDHGSLPKGQYTFSMFFNDMNFRVNKIQLT